MIAKTYTLTSAIFSGTIIFKFDLNGNLILFSLEDAALSEAQKKWLYRRVPIEEKYMQIFHKSKKFKVQEGVLDLSFKNFYEKYNHKVNRMEAEALWKKASKTNKIKALFGIPGYDRYLNKTGLAKTNPARYLRKQYYLDEAYQ